MSRAGASGLEFVVAEEGADTSWAAGETENLLYMVLVGSVRTEVEPTGGVT